MQDDLGIMQEHLSLIKKQSKCSNNALICYSYNNGEDAEGYYQPSSMNIGDYIQSLAARQFFPNIDTYIDRDMISDYQGVPVNMIMNAWYRLWERNKRFSDKVRPLFVAFHLNNPEDITVETLNYLKTVEPIGCRDLQTRDFLKKSNIKAYFSGCMTLTLGNTYRKNDSDREKIVYLVDCDKKYCRNAKVRSYIKNILKMYPDCKIVKRCHMYPKGKDALYGLSEAEALVKEYAKATLVITSRIHCALPCLSLNTPVVLLSPKFDEKRFLGLFSFFNFVGVDDKNNFHIDIEKDENGFIKNKQNHVKYKDFLTTICREFAPEVSSSFKGINQNYFSEYQKNKNQKNIWCKILFWLK